jgi:hypothetical protein
VSASTSIPTAEHWKPRSWFRRHVGDPLARVLLARVAGPGAVLEVEGTRATRRIPIMIWPRDGRDYVVGLFGVTPWVRDIRAGRSVQIVRGGRARAVQLPELSPEETAEYLRWYVAKYPGQGRRYFGLKKPTGTAAEAQALAQRHPVFLIEET